MYLNIGGDVILYDQDIVGVFDLDKITVFKVNRTYLSTMEKKGKIVNTTENLPKSFVLFTNDREDIVYLSHLLPSTLLKRNNI